MIGRAGRHRDTGEVERSTSELFLMHVRNANLHMYLESGKSHRAAVGWSQTLGRLADLISFHGRLKITKVKPAVMLQIRLISASLHQDPPDD